jgi:divalent metal cation (Fe/Co/Zn/Cd) transporter
MPVLPNHSKCSLIKGMWFYHKDRSCEIHVYMSVFGKQVVYFNGKEVSSIFSFKMKTKHHFENAGHQYSVISQPSNVVMTAFETTIRKNEIILKSFTTHYNFDWQRILVLFVAIFGVNILVELFKFPDWTRWVGMLLAIILIIIIFSKSLIHIKEFENPMAYEEFG